MEKTPGRGPHTGSRVGAKWLGILDTAKERSEKILDVLSEYDPDTKSLSKLCAKNGVAYPAFRTWVERLSASYVGKNKVKIPDYDALLPEEKLFMLVFHCSEQEVGVMMPEEPQDAILAAIDTLGDREKGVLTRRYIDGLSLSETGEEYGLTPERIRQIEARAIRKLRHPARLEILKYGQDVHDEAMRLFQAEHDKKVTELKNKLLERDEIYQKAKAVVAEAPSRYDIRIEDLGLSTRAYNVLKRAGYRTVGDLKGVTYADLIRLRNMGVGTAEEVVRALSGLGVVDASRGTAKFWWIEDGTNKS